MKVNVDKLNGKVLRDTEVYVVEDNTTLNNLTLSKTILHPGKCTSGHTHPGLEEVYFFTSGYGTMQLNEDKFPVQSGDIVLIPDGAFHKVYNESTWSSQENSKADLVFVCVFQKYDR